MKQISDITLERYLLGELPPGRMEEITDRIKADSTLRTRLKMLEQSNRDILGKYPVNEMSNRIKNIAENETSQKIKKKERGYNQRKYTLPSLALTAVFVSILIFTIKPYQHISEKFISDKSTEKIEFTRLKGDSTKLYVYRKTNSDVEILPSETRGQEGDLLQLAYSTKDSKYGMIFSVDGRGTVTLHFPESPDSSTKLKSDEKVFLDSAYELDDAPDFERFYFITSDNPVKVNRILEKAEETAVKDKIKSIQNLIKDNAADQTSLIIYKGEK